MEVGLEYEVGEERVRRIPFWQAEASERPGLMVRSVTAFLFAVLSGLLSWRGTFQIRDLVILRATRICLGELSIGNDRTWDVPGNVHD